MESDRGGGCFRKTVKEGQSQDVTLSRDSNELKEPM